EAILVQVLALGHIQVELAQASKVNLLLDNPLRTDSNGGVTVALRLVPVLPAKAATATATTATAVVVATLSATSALEATAATTLAHTATLATATEDSAATTAKGTLAGRTGIVDNGERRLVLSSGDSEETASTSAIDMLV
ncbi:hypothetical protein KEM55_005858, partial [Ascosphaera atra]